jgi:hypothetical protein
LLIYKLSNKNNRSIGGKISAVGNNKRNIAYGFKWKYFYEKEDEDELTIEEKEPEPELPIEEDEDEVGFILN